MDSIDVPIYQQSDRTSIDHALKELRRMKRGGLLIRNRDEYRLLFAGDLLRARRDGMVTVQDIPAGYPVMVATDEHVHIHGLNLLEPQRTGQGYEAMLDQHKVRFGVLMRDAPLGLSSGGVTATRRVVTRFETLVATLSMTGGYECDGVPKHYFPEPYASAGEECPLRGECRRNDGSTPRVRVSK